MQRQQCLMWLLTYHSTGPGRATGRRGRVVFVCVFDDNFLGRLLRVDLIYIFIHQTCGRQKNMRKNKHIYIYTTRKKKRRKKQ